VVQEVSPHELDSRRDIGEVVRLLGRVAANDAGDLVALVEQ
jgi:hypothetical protein